MSAEETIVPVLADIVRMWLTEDPLLNEHFFVHKLQDEFYIRLKCEQTKPVTLVTYNEVIKPGHKFWYGLNKIDVLPSNPKFFEIIEKEIRQEHNKIHTGLGRDCNKQL